MELFCVPPIGKLFDWHIFPSLFDFDAIAMLVIVLLADEQCVTHKVKTQQYVNRNLMIERKIEEK